jgi:DNA polymerase III delta subunit
MLEHAEIKDFEITDLPALKSKLVSVYEGKVPSNVLDVILELKGNNFENIKNELDKILITKEKVILADLEHISKDLEENIFDIISLFLNSQTKTAILQLRELASFLDNHYLIYNSLL